MKRKIKWKCRRGILELDILLERFYDSQFHTLTAKEKKLFTYLLDQSDVLLYDWLLGNKIAKDFQLQDLIRKISYSL
ncbi:FAD assembly factor SdhE [Coxiella endosymbiont of Amblyomma americanum]|uniref:FAD assembly factor SdhE n=1 Tax=Coxiella endosymbiont of Amblyomma americanum TaxID=325775 RepID=UPI000AD54197|nr:succinate dehydrogenase assembly factor 2 [Coxiella endosymbiont of Amblyomma americanum]